MLKIALMAATLAVTTTFLGPVAADETTKRLRAACQTANCHLELLFALCDESFEEDSDLAKICRHRLHREIGKIRLEAEAQSNGLTVEQYIEALCAQAAKGDGDTFFAMACRLPD